MADMKLKPCPKCGREINLEDMYLPDRDWHPTYYDPDSGGNPISLRCKCGIEFCAGTHDWNEFVKEWNTRQWIARFKAKMEEKNVHRCRIR